MEINNSKKLNKLQICHLCLIKNGKFIDLMSKNTLENNLRKKISEIFNFEILSRDNFPWLICSTCSEKIETFSIFYDQVFASQKALKTLFEELEDEIESEEEPLISPFDPLLIINSVPEDIFPFHSTIIKSDIGNDKQSDSDDDKPLITRTKLNKEINSDLNENLVLAQTKPMTVDDSYVKPDELTDDSNCTLSKIANKIRRTKRKVNLSSEKISPIIHSKLSRKTKKGRKDNDDDENNEVDSPKLNHRIKLDAPIRQFFDLKCKKCDNEKFLTFTTMKKHMEQFHSQPGYVTCCNRNLYRREAIMEHITYHLNPEKFVCVECNQNCKSKITLKIHMKQHIPNEQRPFHCAQCNQGFVLKSQLQSHEKSHYTDEQKKFVCEECGKAFAFKFVLEKHVQHMHIREKNFMCEICARSFVDKVNLTAHKRTHDINIPRLQCPFCDARLKNKVTLKIHMRVHNPTVHTCSICNRILTTKNALMNHIQYVHSDKRHTCNFCDKSFKKALTLKEHMTLHTGEVLYKCKYCTKNFNAKANMYSHVKKMHNKEWAEAKHLKWLDGS